MYTRSTMVGRLTKGERLCLKPMVTRVSLSCFNPKKRYSSKAIQIFNDLHMLSGIPKHTKMSLQRQLQKPLKKFQNMFRAKQAS
ncbi:unnamed protein product [Pocillopora meandrina]|uniref:Uncharacterized protein n=1 Tax=Pocillopora meandrina TaxID=46732 RepID=A0AAU9WGU8_9CNID|nr:unnamed protein product [Pocillopora meandrina]